MNIGKLSIEIMHSAWPRQRDAPQGISSLDNWLAPHCGVYLPDLAILDIRDGDNFTGPAVTPESKLLSTQTSRFGSRPNSRIKTGAVDPELMVIHTAVCGDQDGRGKCKPNESFVLLVAPRT